APAADNGRLRYLLAERFPLLFPVPLACALASAAARAAASGSAARADALATMRIRRDLRRAALLGCRMPRSAAWSRAFTAAVTSVTGAVSPPSTRRRTRVTLVFTAERTTRFRSCFLEETSTLFLADLILA